jgi:hypothetical protein
VQRGSYSTSLTLVLQAPQQRQANFTSTEFAVAGEHQLGIEAQGVEIVRILMARRDTAIMRAVTMAR